MQVKLCEFEMDLKEYLTSSGEALLSCLILFCFLYVILRSKFFFLHRYPLKKCLFCHLN